MRALVCVDGPDWEAVILSCARYLSGEDEATLAHVVDERPSRGYEMALRGLLGRRDPRDAGQEMARASREAAEGLLADAKDLLQQLRPGTAVETAVLAGDPNHELVRAAAQTGARTIFIGRGTPGTRPRETVSGVASSWNLNRKGEADGLLLYDGTEVRFPPHRAGAIRAAVREGAQVEASGAWHGRRLHAYSITDARTGTRVEAHKPPGEHPGKRPLGHTARFVVDHASCDVVVLHP